MNIYYSEFVKGCNVAKSNYAEGDLQEVLSEFHKHNNERGPTCCIWGSFCLHPDGEQLNLIIGKTPCGEAALIIYPTKESCLANLTECLNEGNTPKIDAKDLV